MSDNFDKSSTLKIDGEVLNRSSFMKTADDKLARRIGNEATNPLFVDSKGLVQGEDYDRIDVTYPTTSSEVFTYSLSASNVQVITITYVTSSKKDILNVVYS